MTGAAKPNPYQVTARQPVYQNPWLALREDRVIHPSGRPGLFGVVTLQPGVCVLPVAGDGTVWLMRLWRYAQEREALEAVSGGIDGTETPLAAAQRELREEAGLAAGQWLDAGPIESYTSVITAQARLFLALDPRQVPHQPDPDEPIQIERMSLEAALDAIERGEIRHSASMVLLFKAARRLGR